MAKASPALTEDDSKYEGPSAPPAMSTIRTRSKTNRIKLERIKPRVQFDQNSLKPNNVEKIKLKTPSINSIKKPKTIIKKPKTIIKTPDGKGKGTPKATKTGVPRKPATLRTPKTPKIDKLKDNKKKKNDQLNDKNGEKIKLKDKNKKKSKILTA